LQIPNESHLARGAKHAAHGAARLRAYTRGESTGVPHYHGLNHLSVRQTEQHFAGLTVAAGNAFAHLREVALENGTPMAFEPALKRGCQVASGYGVELELGVKNFPEALGMKRSQTVGNQTGLELLKREVVERGRMGWGVHGKAVFGV
jgi:hypothetical protein